MKDSTSPLLLIQAKDYVELTQDVHRNADIIGILYGSLPRPPDSQSLVVCLWFLQSLYKHIDSRYISVDDFAIWSFSHCGCYHRELQFWLELLAQILGSGISDGWFVMLLDLFDFKLSRYMQFVSRDCNSEFLILVYNLIKLRRFNFFVASSVACYDVEKCTVSESTFRHQNLLRQGKNSKFAVVICCLDLREVDCYAFLQLESLVYEIYEKMLMKSGGLQVMAPPELTGFYTSKIAAMKREVCSFEALLIDVVERILEFHSCVEAHMRQMKQRSPLIEIFHQFHSYVSAHMRLMEQNSPLLDVMEVIFLSRLTKGNSLSSKWLDLHVIIGSQSCVSRHEKIWSWKTTLICDFDSTFAGKEFWFKHKMFGWLKTFARLASRRCAAACYGFVYLVPLKCRSMSHGFRKHIRRMVLSFPFFVLDSFLLCFTQLLLPLHKKKKILKSVFKNRAKTLALLSIGFSFHSYGFFMNFMSKMKDGLSS